MGRKRTLYTIRGLKARLLKLLVGTPILLVGALIVGVGLEDPAEGFVIMFIGGLFALGGALALLSAITNDEVAITMGGGSSRE